jgi:hypothetical protein
LYSFIAHPSLFFENSALILMIKGEMFLSGPRLAFFIILNTFSVLSILAYIKTRNQIPYIDSVLFLASILWNLFLTSPFTGKDVYERLLFISVVPLTFIVIYAFYYLPKKASIPVAVVLSFFILLTVVTMPKRKSFISKEEYADLKELKTVITNPTATMVIAEHGMEWWAAWVLRTKVSIPSAITQGEYKKYKTVLYIQSGNNKTKKGLPANAIKIEKGKELEFYRLYIKSHPTGGS